MTTPRSSDEAQELQKLSDEATPGPWVVRDYVENMYGEALADIDTANGLASVTQGGPVEDGGDYCAACSPADAAFIVALVNAYREGRLAADAGEVPALREQIEQLEQERDEAYSKGFEQVRRRCEAAEAERDRLLQVIAAVEAVIAHSQYRIPLPHNRGFDAVRKDELVAALAGVDTPTPTEEQQ